MFGFVLLAIGLSLAPLVTADAPLSSSHCCEALRNAGLIHGIVSPAEPIAYNSHVAKYFSVSARLSPHCFFQPENTAEVSEAIKTLVSTNHTKPCQFAVRGGGHIHFAGAAGIHNGVTIDLGRMKNIVHHKQNSTVAVGAGAVWDDVYSHLDKMDVMVAGARASSVGVGGSTLGGGNSYYAARKGLICDGVRRFEVVLGDGSIITASREKRPDLFRALKGGSSNFGIVTRFDYDAFEGGKIFGGVVTRPLTTADQQFSALYNFANAIASDPYSSIIVISVCFSSQGEPFFMDVMDHTKPARPADIPIMKEFFDIPHKLSDSTGLRNMTSLAAEFEVPKDHRTSFSTITFKNDIRVMRKAHEAFQKVVNKLKAEAKGDWAIYTLYQPIPPLFAQHGNERGGNVIGLDRFSDTLILYEPYLKWQGAEQDDLFNGQARFLREQINSYAKSTGADNEWIYLNYADYDQRPLESYGAENVERIRAAAEKYDPKGVFQYMMPGGFKISKVDQKAMKKTQYPDKGICWADEASRMVCGYHPHNYWHGMFDGGLAHHRIRERSF